jgi:hypothetical protein
MNNSVELSWIWDVRTIFFMGRSWLIVPMILVVAAPRQVLSRHFHNEYEIYHYAEIEYQQRKKEFSGLAEMFWNTTPIGHQASELKIPSDKEDAGPIIDACHYPTVFSNHQLVQGFRSVDSSQESIFASTGVSKKLAGWLSPPNRVVTHVVAATESVRRPAVVEDDRLYYSNVTTRTGAHLDGR